MVGKPNNYRYTEATMDSLTQAIDPAWQCPQSHTILVAPGGKIVYRHNDKVEEEELLTAILKFMTIGYQPSP